MNLPSVCRHMTMLRLVAEGTFFAFCSLGLAAAAEPAPAWKAFENGRFSWKASEPLVAPEAKAADPAIRIKNPSIIRYEGRWHLLCSVRLASGKVGVQYLSFADWRDADRVPRHLLNLHESYCGAPQVLIDNSSRDGEST